MQRLPNELVSLAAPQVGQRAPKHTRSSPVYALSRLHHMAFLQLTDSDREETPVISRRPRQLCAFCPLMVALHKHAINVSLSWRGSFSPIDSGTYERLSDLVQPCQYLEGGAAPSGWDCSSSGRIQTFCRHSGRTKFRHLHLQAAAGGLRQNEWLPYIYLGSILISRTLTSYLASSEVCMSLRRSAGTPFQRSVRLQALLEVFGYAGHVGETYRQCIPLSNVIMIHRYIETYMITDTSLYGICWHFSDLIVNQHCWHGM